MVSYGFLHLQIPDPPEQGYFEMNGNCYLILLHPQVHKLSPLELKESLHQLFTGEVYHTHLRSLNSPLLHFQC